MFCSMLALQRQANFRELPFWALIETTAYYGWGVRNTVINGSPFWGMTVSRCFRDRQYATLIDGITERQMKLLAKDEVISVIWDNYQRKGQPLKDQRARSSRFLLGTHEAAL